MEAEGLDHLAAIPDVRVPGLALTAFMAAFGVFFSLYSRPWKARDPRSRAHIGIGAFNLIGPAAYRAVGGHRAIAMRPDDDMKLGKVLKQHGFRQEAVSGRGLVVVEWYATLRELVDGLMKNAFAGVDYSLVKVAGSTIALFLVNVWPFIAVFVTERPDACALRRLRGSDCIDFRDQRALRGRAHGVRPRLPDRRVAVRLHHVAVCGDCRNARNDHVARNGVSVGGHAGKQSLG